jgi:hypothetical protein
MANVHSMMVAAVSNADVNAARRPKGGLSSVQSKYESTDSDISTADEASANR